MDAEQRRRAWLAIETALQWLRRFATLLGLGQHAIVVEGSAQQGWIHEVFRGDQLFAPRVGVAGRQRFEACALDSE